MLRTYDTAKYFVVVMVPLIPLGKLKILDECPKCKNHRVAKLKVWEREGAKAVETSLAAFEADPDNRDLARAALGATVGFYRQDDFDELSGALVQAFPEDVKIRTLVANGQSHFGQTEAAEASYYEAIALPDSDDARHNLILNLCRKGDPDAALALLPMLDATPPSENDADACERDRDVAGQTLATAEALGAAARADEGVALLEERLADRSDLRDNASFVELRKRLEKGAKSGKAVKAKLVGGAARQAQGGGGVTRYAAVAAMVLVPLLILGGFTLVSLNKAKKRWVNVVNGSPEHYAVAIDGNAAFTVTPGLPPAIPMAEGDHTFQIELPDGRILPSGQFKVTGGFFTRPFSKTAQVLNPDGLAMVIREVHVYGQVSTPPSSEVLVPSYFSQQPSVEHPFTEAPDSVTIEGSGEVRIGLSQETPEFIDALGWIFDHEGPKAGAEYALRYLVFDPNDPVAIGVASSHPDAAAFAAVVGPLLAQRPVLLNLHRMDQNRREASGEAKADLLTEYEALLVSEPDNPDLHYLVGRVRPVGGGEGMGDFDRAIALQSDHPAAHLGRGYLRMVHGAFEDAADDLEVAAQFEDDPLGAWPVYEMALWGTADGRRVRRETGLAVTADNLFDMRASLMAAALATEEAQVSRRDFDAGLMSSSTAMDVDLAEMMAEENMTEEGLFNHISADAAYVLGDSAPMRALYAQEDMPPNFLYPARGAWYAAVLQGDAAAAVAAVDEDADLDVLLPTLALLAAHGENATAMVDATVELLSADVDNAPLAAVFDSEASLDFATLNNAEVLPHLKIPLLLIAAENHAILASEARSLAKKLNGDPRWPHLLYAELLK